MQISSTPIKPIVAFQNVAAIVQKAYTALEAGKTSLAHTFGIQANHDLVDVTLRTDPALPLAVRQAVAGAAETLLSAATYSYMSYSDKGSNKVTYAVAAARDFTTAGSQVAEAIRLLEQGSAVAA